MNEKGPKFGNKKAEESEKFIFSEKEKKVLAKFFRAWLSKYHGLPPRLKDRLVRDFMDMTLKGASPEDIVDRLRQVALSYAEFSQLSWEDSDREYLPEIPKDEQITAAEDRGISQAVSRYIFRLEQKIAEQAPKKPNPKPH